MSDLQNDFSTEEIFQSKNDKGKIQYSLADGTKVSKKGLRWNCPVPPEERIQPRSKEEEELFKVNFDLIQKAVSCKLRWFEWTGSETKDDFFQAAAIGLLTGIRAARFPNHPNQRSYLAAYCNGYILHQIYKNSRMVRPTARAIAEKAHDLGHQNLETYGDDFMRSSDNEDFLLPNDFKAFVALFTEEELQAYNRRDLIPCRLQPMFDELQEKYFMEDY